MKGVYKLHELSMIIEEMMICEYNDDSLSGDYDHIETESEFLDVGVLIEELNDLEKIFKTEESRLILDRIRNLIGE